MSIKSVSGQCRKLARHEIRWARVCLCLRDPCTCQQRDGTASLAWLLQRVRLQRGQFPLGTRKLRGIALARTQFADLDHHGRGKPKAGDASGKVYILNEELGKYTEALAEPLADRHTLALAEHCRAILGSEVCEAISNSATVRDAAQLIGMAEQTLYWRIRQCRTAIQQELSAEKLREKRTIEIPRIHHDYVSVLPNSVWQSPRRVKRGPAKIKSGNPMMPAHPSTISRPITKAPRATDSGWMQFATRLAIGHCPIVADRRTSGAASEHVANYWRTVYTFANGAYGMPRATRALPALAQ